MHFLTKKIPAQALHFALLVASIGALSLSALLLLSHTYRFFNVKSNALINLHKTSTSYFFQKHSKKLSFKDTLETQIEEASIQTKDYQSFYGCWRKSYTQQQQHNFQSRLIGLVGSQLNNQTPNFYLKNSNSPLILVGDTRLKGNFYVPSSGVRPGIIQGNYYTGRTLINGNQRKSKGEIPQLESQWLQYLKQLGRHQVENSIVSNELETTLKNSFLNKTMVIHTFGNTHLSNHQLYGNIIITSNSKIYIGANSDLKDVILIAPEIEIASNVTGNFQCFATRKIKVGKKCKLLYPSSLVVDHRNFREKLEKQNAISIDESTSIKGSIVYLEKNKEQGGFRSYSTNIKIAKNTTIEGEVYCEGSIEFLGDLYGSLYTYQTEVNAYGSKYINHLYNCKILPLPVTSYGGLPFKNADNYTLARWLY